MLYHVKSTNQCTIVKIEKPAIPKILAFKTSVVPIVNHHKIKPAFAAVVQIPDKNESLREFLYSMLRSLFLNALIPIYIIKNPPISPIVITTKSGIINWLTQKYIKNINGISTIPWPSAINNPAVFLSVALFIVTANKGPGSSTPEKEIRTTENRKK